MAVFPRLALIIFGVSNALSFFLPGLKYHRQRARSGGGNQTSDAG